MAVRRNVLAVTATLAVLIAVFLASPNQPQAQTRVEPNGPVGKLASAQTQDSVFELLDQDVDMKEFQVSASLEEMLEVLREVVLKRTREHLRFFVNTQAFKEGNPDAEDLNKRSIQFPRLQTVVSLREALQLALAQLETYNAIFYVKNGAIWITTREAARAETKLSEPIVVRYTGKALAAVCEDLSSRAGITISIDVAAVKLAERPVHATFRGDISLAGALHTLAESADLKVILLDGAVYLTTPARADQLRKEVALQQKGRDPLWPKLPLELKRDQAASN